MKLPKLTGQWDWYLLSKHIPLADIIAHPDKPWNRLGLSKNKTMTVSGMDELDKVMTSPTHAWDWFSLSRYINASDIKAHPDKPWNRCAVSMNRWMTVALMDELNEVLVNATGSWGWWTLSIHAPMSDILVHPDKPWNRLGLSQNKEMTLAMMDELDEVLGCNHGEWDWYLLSMVIPMSDIKAHPDLPWDREGLSRNNEMTVSGMRELDDALTNCEEFWECYYLMEALPIDDLRRRPRLPMDYEGLASNPGITVDDVLYLGVTSDIGSTIPIEEVTNNPLFPWKRKELSENPRITMEMVIANPDD